MPCSIYIISYALYIWGRGQKRRRRHGRGPQVVRLREPWRRRSPFVAAECDRCSRTSCRNVFVLRRHRSAPACSLEPGTVPLSRPVFLMARTSAARASRMRAPKHTLRGTALLPSCTQFVTFAWAEHVRMGWCRAGDMSTHPTSLKSRYRHLVGV